MPVNSLFIEDGQRLGSAISIKPVIGEIAGKWVPEHLLQNMRKVLWDNGYTAVARGIQ
ncbi:hypothetical protein CLFE_029690 [Clostridium felsineum DSM 794]|nr:hypothetical protein CLFE_029690 [Clostridium felsineum DSM 794]